MSHWDAISIFQSEAQLARWISPLVSMDKSLMVMTRDTSEWSLYRVATVMLVQCGLGVCLLC